MEIVNRPLVRNGKSFVVQGGPEAGATVVKRDGDTGEWKPVENFERNIEDSELSRSYGLWKDKEVKSGFIFRKTVREKDGYAQSDEVQTFREVKDVERKSNTWDPGPKIQTRTGFQIRSKKTSQDTLVILEERWNPCWDR
jgi:hypothetical protein